MQRRLALAADGTVIVIDADGARHAFTNPVTQGTVTTYTRPVTLYATLVKDTANPVEFTLTYRDQSRDTFDIFGTTEAILIRAEDRYANGVTLAYVGGTNRISTITDTAGGRTVDFAYDGSNRLASITDWAWISTGVVQPTATGARRQYRFFYDGSGILIGWSDPSNTTGSCPTGGSHLTCLTYTGGLLTAVGKTQTYTTLVSGALGTATQGITTQVSYLGTEVATVKDAEEYNAGGEGTLISGPRRARRRSSAGARPARVSTRPRSTSGSAPPTRSAGLPR